MKIPNGSASYVDAEASRKISEDTELRREKDDE